MGKDAVTLRQKEQKTLYRNAVLTGDRPLAKAIKNRMAAEQTKLMYAKNRNARGVTKTGITRLEVPHDPTERNYKSCIDWITIDTPREIEERLIAHNRSHFGQADGTFPTTPPFSEWVDWAAPSHTADLILEGDWSSPDVDALSNDLLHHMSRRTQLDSITDTITPDQWADKTRNWPESTSTSPSGFHLTHSKALIASLGIPLDTPEGALLETRCQDLIRWQVSLLNLAIQHCYSFDRWKTIVNVMILKEPNNFKINRLRVIQLYEHDYNLLLACKWRNLIQLTTQQQLLNPAQFGGVPGRDAALPTMIKEYQYKISRASKHPLIHLDYDATACYDCIIMLLASLASRAYGQHRSVVFVNAATLQEARYNFKTQLGVSDSFYKHCKIFPIYGSGQGAGNSPAIWCVISSVLFDLYDSGAHSATFTSPDGSVTVRVFLIGFVDDTSSSVNDFDSAVPLPPAHYATLAQAEAQRWNDVLHLSGGALQEAKCSFHFLYYSFTIDGLPILRGGQFGPMITIQPRNSTPQPLQHLSAYSPHKTLGVYKAPSNTRTTAFKVLRDELLCHAQVVARSAFNRVDTWAYYHAVYLPSMTYSFLSSSLTLQQCDMLQLPFKKVLVPR